MRRGLALALCCAFAVAPFLYVVSTSLKQTRALFDYPPQWIPHALYVGNYTKLLGDYPFLQWVANTLFVASTVTAHCPGAKCRVATFPSRRPAWAAPCHDGSQCLIADPPEPSRIGVVSGAVCTGADP